MLITDKNELLRYRTEYRLWQGIPSVEVTKRGRLFVTFYSGERGERVGNFSMVVKSDDGVRFSEPIAVAYKDAHRCFDPCLWIDPLGRLWFTWAEMPDDAVYAVICDDPDAKELVWSEVFYLGEDVMMNKPTVLSSGEWLFPVAVWKREIRRIYAPAFDENKKPGAYVYKTVDCGRTFERLGGADVHGRDFDEHMVVELCDQRLANYVRTDYGIGVAYSYDRGKTWSKSVDTGYGGAESRFHIRRLRSGRLFMVNHEPEAGRKTRRINLTAYLSEDDGRTWPYRLLLDERDWVSYPDAAEGEDGTLYIVYDRERGGSGSLQAAYARAREILMAKITEADILAGELVSPSSCRKQIVSKLGKYADEASNPYGERDRFSDEELAHRVLQEAPDNVVGRIFEYYPVNCVNMQRSENRTLDMLIEKLEAAVNPFERERIVREIISLIRSVSAADVPNFSPVVNAVKELILADPVKEISVREIAEKTGVSLYYMMHQFKKFTGITIMEYKTELKLTAAKRMLVSSDISISRIAQECGFGTSSYFAKVFLQSEKLSPSEYRKMLKQ